MASTEAMKERLNDFIVDVRKQLDDALEHAFNEYDEPEEIKDEWRRQIRIKNIKGQYLDFIEELFGSEERYSDGFNLDNIMSDESYVRYPYTMMPLPPLIILPYILNKPLLKLIRELFEEKKPEDDLRTQLTHRNNWIIQLIEVRTERIIKCIEYKARMEMTT